MKKSKLFLLSVLVLALAGINTQCTSNQESGKNSKDSTVVAEKPSITKSDYGVMPSGEKIEKFTMKNAQGMELDIITYGGIITKWTAPNKDGIYQDIVLGYDSLSQYLKSNPYFGAIIGRYGNRINKGKFSIEGTDYQLETNNNTNHLHGGFKGFDKVVWTAQDSKTDSTVSLKLTYKSKDGEGGYPGNLSTVVTYTLNNNNELEVIYEAQTDKKTIVNLTQHSYFNLSGNFNETILNHQLKINAEKFVPVDETLIPTGEFAKVEETAFDFREFKTIGQDIENNEDQLKKGLGYDHDWVVADAKGEMKEVCQLYHKESGRLLTISSVEPGLQFYSGNFLDGTLPMKGGQGTYAHRTGLCLETQHHPDSPNQESFPSVILNPGEKYQTKTIFKFSVK